MKKIIHFLRKPPYLVALILFGLWSWICFWAKLPQHFNNSELWVLGVTAIAIFIYTVETSTQVELTSKQIQIDIRPVMVVVQNAPNFRLQNIGRSPALNIKVEPLNRKEARLVFPERLLCVEKEAYELRPQQVYREGQEIRGSDEAERTWKGSLICLWNEEYKLLVRYRDLEGISWKSEVRVTSESVELLSVVKG